jgi:putative aldouronate transport system permease protein
MVRKKIKYGLDDRIIKVLSYVIVIMLTVVCVLPFLRILAQAFSSELKVSSGQIGLLPVDFSLKAIQFVLKSNQFVGSLQISVLATIVFVALAMILTVLTAYPLSRGYLPGVKYLNFFLVFTMLFNGGIIPTYMVVKYLGMINTFWALVIPCVISAFNVVILISFMRNIPIEYEEAAKIEGASPFTILVKVMLPLSKPTLATLLLFYAVARWNMWFDVVMYVNDSKFYTLQVVLRNLLMATDNSILKSTMPIEAPLVSVRAASVIFTIAPIIILYPFLQKHFVKGVMLGGIKG